MCGGANGWWCNVVEIGVMANIIGGSKGIIIVGFIGIGISGEIVVIRGVGDSWQSVRAIYIRRGRQGRRGRILEVDVR